MAYKHYTEVRIPHKAYNVLRDLVNKHGGVGRFRYFTPSGKPLCLFGFIRHMVDIDDSIHVALERAFLAGDFKTSSNDVLVTDFISRHPRRKRVPWKDYIKAARIKRG